MNSPSASSIAAIFRRLTKYSGQPWIPAFAGMTSNRIFAFAGLTLIGVSVLGAGAEPRFPKIQPEDEIKFFKRTFPDERRESFFNYEGRALTYELG